MFKKSEIGTRIVKVGGSLPRQAMQSAKVVVTFSVLREEGNVRGVAVFSIVRPFVREIHFVPGYELNLLLL
jgi:hypothetical protein